MKKVTNFNFWYFLKTTWINLLIFNFGGTETPPWPLNKGSMIFIHPIDFKFWQSVEYEKKT